MLTESEPGADVPNILSGYFGQIGVKTRSKNRNGNGRLGR